MTVSPPVRDAGGEAAATRSPDLGIDSDMAAVKRHLVDVPIGDGGTLRAGFLGSP